jgi:hypothetical protein
VATQEQHDEQIKLFKSAIINKYSAMTLDQIADDVIVLVDKAMASGFDAGVEITRQKVNENIKNWEREQILKVLMT